jgi:hypothetical protein
MKLLGGRQVFRCKVHHLHISRLDLTEVIYTIYRKNDRWIRFLVLVREVRIMICICRGTSKQFKARVEVHCFRNL